MRNKETYSQVRKQFTFPELLRASVLAAVILCGLFSDASAQAFYKGIQNIQITTGYGGYYKGRDKDIFKSSSNPIYMHAKGIKHASLRKVDPYYHSTKSGLKKTFDKHLLYSPYSFAIHYDYGYKQIRIWGYSRKKYIGLGGYFGTRTFREREPSPENPISFDRKWRYYTLMGEAKLHWDFAGTRFDPYFNVALGIQMWRYKTLNIFISPPAPGPRKNHYQLAGEVSAGTRYFFARNTAVIVEGGFGVYYLKIGLNFILIP